MHRATLSLGTAGADRTGPKMLYEPFVPGVSDTTAPAEKAVDGRVEGAIESLNTAIDNLNTVEHTREACIASALRGASVVRDELEELDQEFSLLEHHVVPFIAARAAATDAIDLARAADATWRCACAVLDQAKRDLELGNVDSRAGKKQRSEAAKLAKSTRNDYLRRNRDAEEKAVRLGQLADVLMHTLQMAVTDAMEQHADYLERRAGLQQVLDSTEERLGQLEAAKEAATEDVSAAMEGLEALSLELHRTEDQGGASSPRSPRSPAAAGSSAQGASAAPWEADAAWRPSPSAAAWSDGSESDATESADEGFVEEARISEEDVEEGGGARSWRRRISARFSRSARSGS